MNVDKSKTRLVRSRSVKDGRTRLKLSDGTMFESRRYFPVGKGDQLYTHQGETYVFAKEDNSWIPIGSTWTFDMKISVGGVSIPVSFKEIDNESELFHYQKLREFHYRGGGGAGRNVPIIATSKLWDLPNVLGFVEVSSSMIANSARKKFFDSPYKNKEGVRWLTWDREATRKYSNSICRISRFVIHPEIRGLGLAKHFVEAAIKFSSIRWHTAGRRPEFIEITADMLRFYPFVDGSPFKLMGETEGNAHRLSKDMNYLVQKALSPAGNRAMPQGGGGIMSLQRGCARKIVEYMEMSDVSLAEIIDSLKFDPAKLSQKAWEALYKISRRPKPTYVCGLTDEANSYVINRYNKLFQTEFREVSTKGVKDICWRLRGLNISVSAEIDQTKEGRLLQDTFGFVGQRIDQNLIRDFDLEVESGKVTLVCGASGAGKSLFLDALHMLWGQPSRKKGRKRRSRTQNPIKVSGETDHNANISSMSANLNESSTALDLKGTAGIADFIEIAASCGLAEPQLFVRPIVSLSSGQRYRLMVALAFLEKPEIVIIDNFCEPLDRYTTIAVCRGVQRLARNLGIAVIVASASYERLAKTLDANQTILLRRGHQPKVKRKKNDPKSKV